MFKVWYDICGEYHEEVVDTYEEAKEAFDHATEAMHEVGDYVEIYDLETDCVVESFENGTDEWDDTYDECGFNPYTGCYDYDC